MSRSACDLMLRVACEDAESNQVPGLMPRARGRDVVDAHGDPSRERKLAIIDEAIRKHGSAPRVLSDDEPPQAPRR